MHMPRRWRIHFLALPVLTLIGILSLAGDSARVQTQAIEVPLTAAEVSTLMAAAAQAIDDRTMAAAVVDRGGRILGVYARAGAREDGFIPDTAVTTARTAAHFSNGEAPLSSRTIRAISGIHFPPGVPNTPNAELYGIENTNRGCALDAQDSQPLPRTRSIAGSGLGPGPTLACNPRDQSGCAMGNAVALTNRASTRFVGFATGKNDVLDVGEPLDVPVNPGGFAVYRNGRVVGGVGVAGVSPERAEFAAFAAVTQPAVGLSGLPVNPLPVPGAVFIDGIRLPFFADCISVSCVEDAIADGLQRFPRGTFAASDVLVAARPGQNVPEGYLIAPRASSVPGSLTQAEVQQLIEQAVARASVTRAQIRLPLTRPTSMVIAVSDETGELLAAFRMPDSTIFSFDVATAKARNAYYFSSRAGYDVLRSLVDNNPYDDYSWTPDPPAGQGWAVTNRTLSFGGQPLFPPGIDLEKAPTPGPFFDLFVYDTANPCTEGPGPTRGGNRAYANQSGIVWFPGSAPLYKAGRLVGGVGVSGDGVSQDDYVTAGAVVGFEPPPELRVDRSVITTSEGHRVRLPYFKFPRNPELR